jgi:hypothetical protein
MRRTLVVGAAASLAGLAAVGAKAVVGGAEVQTQAPDAEGVRAAVSACYAALNARDNGRSRGGRAPKGTATCGTTRSATQKCPTLNRR